MANLESVQTLFPALHAKGSFLSSVSHCEVRAGVNLPKETFIFTAAAKITFPGFEQTSFEGG